MRTHSAITAYHTRGLTDLGIDDPSLMPGSFSFTLAGKRHVLAVDETTYEEFVEGFPERLEAMLRRYLCALS